DYINFNEICSKIKDIHQNDNSVKKLQYDIEQMELIKKYLEDEDTLSGLQSTLLKTDSIYQNFRGLDNTLSYLVDYFQTVNDGHRNILLTAKEVEESKSNETDEKDESKSFD
ncbi:MAG: hypothetical protein ACI4TT_02340, partial [Christensenellales bacterium]